VELEDALTPSPATEEPLGPLFAFELALMIAKADDLFGLDERAVGDLDVLARTLAPFELGWQPSAERSTGISSMSLPSRRFPLARVKPALFVLLVRRVDRRNRMSLVSLNPLMTRRTKGSQIDRVNLGYACLSYRPLVRRTREDERSLEALVQTVQLNPTFVTSAVTRAYTRHAGPSR
jgi:hypothetical protein